MSVPAVDDEVVNAAARLLAQRVGLRLDPSIRGRLTRCVVDDAAAHDMEVTTYVDCLDHEPDLMQTLLNRVTVQETSFFRDPNQFAALRDTVLADITGPVSIWSAGCANGQEPYSLAMTLATAGRDDWRVTASDISSRAVERTRQAEYSAREVEGVTADDLSRFFTPIGDRAQVVGSLRGRVDVVRHNLVAGAPPLQADACDIVFCRNVLIYFRHEDVVAFLDRLARWLRPGAWLFLGYSESLWQVTDAFELIRLGEAFAYRRRGAELHTVAAAPSSRVRTVPSPGPSRVRSAPAQRTAPPVPRTTRRVVEPLAHQVTGDNRSSGTGPGAVELSAAGEAAMHAADYTGAVAAFRKCVYLDPERSLAHLHLGLALEAAGDPASARRAYGAARRTLSRSGMPAVEAALEGYEVAELLRLLDTKLRSAS